MTPAVLILIGVVIGIIVGYTLALVVNYWEYWRTHRAPIELDEQLEAFQRLQER